MLVQRQQMAQREQTKLENISNQTAARHNLKGLRVAVSGKQPLCSLWSRTLDGACETPLHRPLDTATAPVSSGVVSAASRRHYATA
ncbi:hypothetical protein PSPO01_15296 [Paraphaeosphaeria sporulosa]